MSQGLPVPPRGQCRLHIFLRCGAGGSAGKESTLEGRQLAAVERGGEGGAPGVGDLGAVEVEQHELLQASSRRRQRACSRRRHEGGEGLVAKRIRREVETLQRGQPPQGWREGHQRRVTDGGVSQLKGSEPRQGASAQGGGERRGACNAHVHIANSKEGHSRQRARAQPRRQPLHAHRAQLAQRRQVGCGAAFAFQLDLPRLAQLLAAPQPHLAAQRCGHLMISPQLLPQHRCQKRPQLAAGAAEVHGAARLECVAQLAEDDALLVTAQLRQRHRRRSSARGAGRWGGNAER
eukprot:scaffold131851_cov75-Phaeocystis_antarctica.AAC.1